MFRIRDHYGLLILCDDLKSSKLLGEILATNKQILNNNPIFLLCLFHRTLPQPHFVVIANTQSHYPPTNRSPAMDNHHGSFFKQVLQLCSFFRAKYFKDSSKECYFHNTKCVNMPGNLVNFDIEAKFRQM